MYVIAALSKLGARRVRREVSVLGTACALCAVCLVCALCACAAPSAAGAQDASSTAAPPERPFYYERPITSADLEGRTLRELTLLRNWIFARAGNPFRKSWLREFFSAQPWYEPLEAMDTTRLTPLDHANAKAIALYELAIPREEILRRRNALARERVTSPDDARAIEVALLSERLGEWLDSAGGAPTPLQDQRLLDKQLTLRQLDDFSRRDLALLRNIVYARRGRTFESGMLQSYFSGFAWYDADPSYSDARLTRIDRRNIKLIRSLEDELGGPLPNDADEWFAAG